MSHHSNTGHRGPVSAFLWYFYPDLEQQYKNRTCVWYSNGSTIQILDTCQEFQQHSKIRPERLYTFENQNCLIFGCLLYVQDTHTRNTSHVNFLIFRWKFCFLNFVAIQFPDTWEVQIWEYSIFRASSVKILAVCTFYKNLKSNFICFQCKRLTASVSHQKQENEKKNRKMKKKNMKKRNMIMSFHTGTLVTNNNFLLLLLLPIFFN